MRRHLSTLRRSWNDQRRRQARLTVVLLGDSITNACRSPVFDWWDLADAGSGYHFRPAINQGGPTQTTADFLTRLDLVIDAAPDWCVVQGGGNDLLTAPPHEVASRLVAIHTELAVAGIATIATTVLPSSRTPPEVTATTNRLLHDAIVGPLCDWSRALGHPTVEALRAPDGTHPAPAGIRAMASELARTLQGLGLG